MIDSVWNGFSDYHALNATLTHRGRGLLGSVAYTWAKSTDSKSAAAGIGANESAGWQGFLNNHDVARDHGLSSFDVAHRVVASFVWNLPFGKGERIGGNASGLKQALIGGWQMNGIYLWQGGFPISVFAADVGGVLDSFGTNRADIVGDIHSGGGTIEQWFNTAAFAQPALGSFGNSGRSILRGPGINNLDLGFFKNFSLPKNATLQFRVEAFNAFNHPQFSACRRTSPPRTSGWSQPPGPAASSSWGRSFSGDGSPVRARRLPRRRALAGRRPSECRCTSDGRRSVRV